LMPPLVERLKSILAEQIERGEQAVVEREVLPDHVPLLVGGDPQFGMHRLVKRRTGYRSHALRAQFPARKHRLLSLRTTSYVVAVAGWYVSAAPVQRCQASPCR